MATKQHHRKTHADPNTQDPLSEPTLNRRLWGAYLAAGYNRSTWAKRTGITYPTANNYDHGKTPVPLDHLMHAVELFGGKYTLDDLAYGYAQRSRRDEPELPPEAIKLLLSELRATSDQIEALGEYAQSPAGKFQRFTRTFVAAFVDRYGLAIKEGMTRTAAIDAAKKTAHNARANMQAIADRLQPVSAEDLAQLGKSLGGSRRTASHPPSRKRKA